MLPSFEPSRQPLNLLLPSVDLATPGLIRMVLAFGFDCSTSIFSSCIAMARSSPTIRLLIFLLRPIAQGHLTTKPGRSRRCLQIVTKVMLLPRASSDCARRALRSDGRVHGREAGSLGGRQRQQLTSGLSQHTEFSRGWAEARKPPITATIGLSCWVVGSTRTPKFSNAVAPSR